jgi:hypothetical protein
VTVPSSSADVTQTRFAGRRGGRPPRHPGTRPASAGSTFPAPPPCPRLSFTPHRAPRPPPAARCGRRGSQRPGRRWGLATARGHVIHVRVTSELLCALAQRTAAQARPSRYSRRAARDPPTPPTHPPTPTPTHTGACVSRDAGGPFRVSRTRPPVRHGHHWDPPTPPTHPHPHPPTHTHTHLSGSHSALPSGMVSCLVKPPTGPGQRVTIPRHPDRDALRAGPPTTSRHYGVGPTTTIGATIRVTEPPPYRSALGLSRSRRARTAGTGVDDF